MIPELITIQRDRPFSEQWQLLDQQQQPVPLHGATFRGALREKAGAPPHEFAIEIEDAAEGLIRLSMTLEQVQALPTGIAHYDVFQDDETAPMAYGPVQFADTMTPA